MSEINLSVRRLQGTDGIRGRVQKQIDCAIEDPVAAFLELGVLTDRFFEIYTYCYCLELIESGIAKPGDSVVIGWDPRDREGVFNQAAIRGVQKSRLNAIQVGVLPTPSIALYLLYAKASCAFVLTASHNPSDQNGIKIFLGYYGLKLFPADDEKFSQRILNSDFNRVSQLPLTGSTIDQSEEAASVFVRFSLEPANSWLTSHSLANQLLIIDAANGSYSRIIQQVFDQLEADVIYTNCDFQEGINIDSGVADIEGVSRIPAELIESESGRFHNYKTLQCLLSEGRSRKTDLLDGNFFCSALVFDGDGDRFFRLDYDPFQDDIIVLSGDKIAYIQGQFLKQKGYWQENPPLFVNTVESDLESSRAALQIGFQTCQTAVGDKWILWQAIFENWKTRKNLLSQLSIDSEFINLLDKCDTELEKMMHQSEFDALKVTKLFLNIEKQFVSLGGNLDDWKNINDSLAKFGQSLFAIGSEESGHTISLGRLAFQNDVQSVYIGNGLKSALNSFAAFSELKPNVVEDYYQWLAEPFVHGYQKSLPIFYVDKNLLEPETPFRRQLQSYLLEYISNVWNDVDIQEIKRSEEPQMLYFLLESKGQLIASIFVRNSGTEDKMSLYFRGRIVDQSKLDQLGNDIYAYLLPRVKDNNKVFAKEEISILKQLEKKSLSAERIFVSNELSPSKNRLLKEIGTKQGLIKFQNQTWKLSNLGKTLLNFSERS